jgi:UDP-N-acetylmuramate dehydrogenase
MAYPAVRGTLTENAPIGAQSWFRCGGSADVLFEPADEADLQDFLKSWDGEITVIGGMANTIVRDGGVRGVVVRLGKAFADIAVDGDCLRAGAGALNGSVASNAAKNSLGGLEFLSGIPGSVGGAIAMNAGAYGSEVKDILVEISGVMRDGRAVTIPASDLVMHYRHAKLPAGLIVTRAVFRGVSEDEVMVRERLKEIKAKRNATQPIKESTGGSTFANPSPEMRAWQVVERVGGRGLQIGGAKMSEMHCNFMVNAGGASAADLETLGDTLRDKAKAELGVELRWEIQRIGER